MLPCLQAVVENYGTGGEPGSDRPVAAPAAWAEAAHEPQLCSPQRTTGTAVTARTRTAAGNSSFLLDFLKLLEYVIFIYYYFPNLLMILKSTSAAHLNRETDFRCDAVP